MTDWSAIIEKHGPLVWRTVYRLLDHEADAADCFQNAFLAAFVIASETRVDNWCGLLKRLATAKALDRLRARYRERERLTALPAMDVTDNHREPNRFLEHAELADQLRIALTAIDDKQAEVFCLACLEDWSYREIASHLSVSVNHVGVLLNRARSNLREMLAEYSPQTGRSSHD